MPDGKGKNGGTVQEDEILAGLVAYLDGEEKAIESALDAIYGPLPQWIPLPSIDRARRIIQGLLNDGFPLSVITRLVGEAERDELSFPGIVNDPSAFAQSVYELAHLRYAISLGKLEGLRCLSGEQARHGQVFREGRKPGTGSPIRKEVARLLKKNPAMKNPELWEAVKAKPPRGWQVFENSAGKYIEGPKMANMAYGRFCTVCGEERKKAKGKITG